LEATHARALEVCPLDALRAFSVPLIPEG